MGLAILWLRNGLRLHDNPALLECIKICKERNSTFLPIFIFDGFTAGTKICGYNRMKFLLDSLIDLDNQFKKFNGKLYFFNGDAVEIFEKLHKYFKIDLIAFEQDCEPIYYKRDKKVKNMCNDLNIPFAEKVSHTLWNPFDVIAANGGLQPLTYQMYLHTIKTLGAPPFPEPDANWDDVKFQNVPKDTFEDLNIFEETPTPENFNIHLETTYKSMLTPWQGGETVAIKNLNERLAVEEIAFQNGSYVPNQAKIDIIGDSKSLSPYIRFGCLSIRKLYWAIHMTFEKVQLSMPKSFVGPTGPHITGQLIWREYFYTMSINNPFYDKMELNEICLNIPWRKPNSDELERWALGRTGFPIIDAAMRQLLSEGWLHHVLRNYIATFLTRGALWISWEYGVEHFLKYLLDADWSVCAGNWMWVSSSAFENLLDSSACTCPTTLGCRLDPHGDYIKKYIPELSKFPERYIHEPWKTPKELQDAIGCHIGVDYPNRIIDFEAATTQNCIAMKNIKKSIMMDNGEPPHCRPSSDDEIRQFFWLV